MKQKFAGLLAVLLVFSFGLIGCDWLFDIDYKVTADGSSTTTSTLLTFVFEEDVIIELNEINITNGTGEVSKGNLNGSGKNYNLAITVIKEGNISVSINRIGIVETAKTVTVFKETPPAGPKTLTITGFGSNHANYYYQIDLFENEDDIKPWFNNTGPESLSKLCLQGQISGGLISKLLLAWDDEKGEYNPFTGTGHYYIFLQVFDMDLEESHYRFDESYYLSAAIDFSGQQDIELTIDHFDGFNPFNGNGGGDGLHIFKGTITGTGFKEVDIIIHYDCDIMGPGVFGYIWGFQFTNSSNWQVVNSAFDPVYITLGATIWGKVEEWDGTSMGPPRFFTITESYDGETYLFENINIDLDSAYG